jgi:hypothetical protein
MSRVVEGLEKIRDGVALLGEALAIEVQMIDGGTGGAGTPANFDLLTSAGGFTSGDYASGDHAAKASFDEVSSLYAKLTKIDGDAVGLALPQACAKHGV